METRDLWNCNIDDLTAQELISIHLDTIPRKHYLRSYILRSTLSILWEAIESSTALNSTKRLLPEISMFAILDQIGTCYRAANKEPSRFGNGIKKTLYYFGEVDQDDELINILYSFRNGLLHNASLSSFDRYKSKYYFFAYNPNIETLYRPASEPWSGSYDELNQSDREKFITLLNISKIRDLTHKCITNASICNESGNLNLELPGGLRQLYYDYIRSKPKQPVNF